jgi:hypothetical protein
MAYIDLSSAFHPTGAIRIGDSRFNEPAGLGGDEWWVVEFARKDGLWSLSPNGLLQRLSRFLFGVRPPPPLANERLEALRRFAVVAWRRGKVGAAQFRDFLAAGFSSGDARQVLDHISGRRRRRTPAGGLD